MTINTIDYLTDRAPGSGNRSRPRARVDSDAPELSLDGDWKFRLLARAPGGPAATGILPQGEADEAIAAESYDDTGWATIPVPSHWVLEGDGRYGRPIYTNVVLPIPIDVPNVPDENPTGDYRRRFELPAGFAGSEAVLLRFDGVESRYKVWVNGIEIGVGSGSRLAQEFDVTDAVRPGSNLLVVRVHQWSASTYIEDQDQWWLPGIFREVTLLARPVGSLDDVWLRTEFDSETGAGTIVPVLIASPSAFPITLSVAELGVEVTWADAHEIKPVGIGPVEPWSAEIPRLYTATVSSTGEKVAVRLGFRTIEIRGDLFTVNDRRLVFHGMNRHETHPERGRVFNEASARADLLLMKQHNVNAIRTSHYPPHPRVLDLADELGFWVILECDLETHAFDQIGWVGNPSNDPAWRDAYLDRIQRTVERDKNHASIVMWSLGNESGTGSNLAAMSAWVHHRDPSRPVHYEGDYSGEYTDVYSRMYPSFAETASIGGDGTTHPLLGCDDAQATRQRSKPYIHCEYAHAMGNGPGSLDTYEDLVDVYPRLHGGFIWEWRDHGMLSKTADGTPFYAFGGDFGETIHDGNFVMDGMVLSDGTPTPGLAEFKAVVAPIRVSLLSAAGSVSLTVTNRQHTAGTAGHRFILRTEHDGLVVSTTEITVPDLAPTESSTIVVPAVGIAAEAETWITLDVVLAADTAWAPAGHLISSAQLDLTPVRVARDRRDSVRASLAGARSVSASPHTLGPATFRGGELIALRGRPVGGLDLSLWRAPTDNDHVNLAAWAAARLDLMRSRVERVDAAPGSVRVLSRHAAGNSALWFTTDVRYTELGDDSLHVRVDITPSAGWKITLPRIGVHIALPTGIDAASWFGTGPAESYPDSLQAARVGAFRSEVDDLNVRYAMPQETGHRRELRSLELSASAVAWLKISTEPDVAGRRPGFTLSRYSAEELTAARHPHELPESSATHLYLDAAQHGLGSAACGPDVEPRFALRAEAHSLEFTISVPVPTV